MWIFLHQFYTTSHSYQFVNSAGNIKGILKVQGGGGGGVGGGRGLELKNQIFVS